MNEHALTILLVIAAVIVIVLAAIVIALFARRKRSERLQGRFGPEYDRALGEYADPSQAENALEEREKRLRKISIRTLSPDERERFAHSWRVVQTEFVDAPGKAVTEADRLVELLMSEIGYPVGQFRQQAEDLSVDHPEVVQKYRLAHEIAERQRRGRATTEELREAMIQYRALYEELLGPQPLMTSEVRR